MTQRDNDSHTEDQHAWHMRAIADITARWRGAEITTGQKRRYIAEENQNYYGAEAPAALTRPGKRYELPAVLAEAAGVEEDVMTLALNAYREDGREGYDQVLAAAGVHRRCAP